MRVLLYIGLGVLHITVGFILGTLYLYVTNGKAWMDAYPDKLKPYEVAYARNVMVTAMVFGIFGVIPIGLFCLMAAYAEGDPAKR